MWMFAIGVFMIALYPSSLELTAIYGFVNSAASLLFGAIIGDMIDGTQRLKGKVGFHFSEILDLLLNYDSLINGSE